MSATLVDLGGGCWDADKTQPEAKVDLLETILRKLVSGSGS